MENNLVSIITPAYNCSKYISQTIESVLCQTYHDFEMIIVDDCSTDDTLSILEKYSKQDSRIKVIKMVENRGVVEARNVALKQSKGRYIAFLDSDDLWVPEKLSKQINFMRVFGYAFTYSQYDLINEEGMSLGKSIKPPTKLDYSKAIKNTSIGCLTVIVDKKKTGEFYMPDLSHGEDHATWIEILKRGFNAYCVHEVLAHYRVSKSSLTSNKLKVVIKQWHNYREYYGFTIPKALYYFVCYILNATLKRI